MPSWEPIKEPSTELSREPSRKPFGEPSLLWEPSGGHLGSRLRLSGEASGWLQEPSQKPKNLVATNLRASNNVLSNLSSCKPEYSPTPEFVTLEHENVLAV